MLKLQLALAGPQPATAWMLKQPIYVACTVLGPRVLQASCSFLCLR